MNTVELITKHRESEVPSCLVIGMDDSEKEEFKKSYLATSYITDKIRDEVLRRLNDSLFPKKEGLLHPNWEIENRERMGYVRCLKEMLEILP